MCLEFLKKGENMEAPIVEIQRFSIHDGPGIRTLVFFKGCYLHCKWCQNPESQNPIHVIAFYRNRCQNSFHCKDVCPENAILDADFRIDYEKCTVCQKCVDACAYDALKLIGTTTTPEELLDKLLVDLPYYKRSGGGVTFTGGEATLYPHFLNHILDLCKQYKIHCTIETCGTFSFQMWEPILRKLDLIYYDLKIMDSAYHKESTGVPNRTIMRNAKILVEQNFPVEFRMLLVQGYIDNDENLNAVIQWLQKMGQPFIHLLKYHNMGEIKIDIIHGNQKKLNLPNYPLDRFEKIKSRFQQNGIEVVHY